MIKIVNAELTEIELLRNEYLKSLPEFQELYIDLMINTSNCYKLTDNEVMVGYAIISEEEVLIEFYLIPDFIPRSNDYFKSIIQDLSVKKVYCKSFDFLLLNCCLMQSWSYSMIGCLFRDHLGRNVAMNNEITARQARESDKAMLMEQNDGIEELFETGEQCLSFITSEIVMLFFIRKDLADCGTILRTHPDWDYYDLGVWVKSSYRRQGMGVQIITHLREYCIKNNWNPTCGCAIDNIASQKTLERSGFYSKHKLINFEIN